MKVKVKYFDGATKELEARNDDSSFPFLKIAAEMFEADPTCMRVVTWYESEKWYELEKWISVERIKRLTVDPIAENAFLRAEVVRLNKQNQSQGIDIRSITEMYEAAQNEAIRLGQINRQLLARTDRDGEVVEHG